MVDRRPRLRLPRNGRSAPITVDSTPAEKSDAAPGWDHFYRVVRLVPRGRVITYGGVAALAGRPRAARHVGYAMAALKESGAHGDVPWHRVMGAASRGRAWISIKDPFGAELQRALLEQEGVVFDERGCVSLERFGWAGPAKRRTARNVAIDRSRRASQGRSNR